MVEPPGTIPDDEHAERLISYVRPRDRTNPTPSGRYNLVRLVLVTPADCELAHNSHELTCPLNRCSEPAVCLRRYK